MPGLVGTRRDVQAEAEGAVKKLCHRQSGPATADPTLAARQTKELERDLLTWEKLLAAGKGSVMVVAMWAVSAGMLSHHGT